MLPVMALLLENNRPRIGYTAEMKRLDREMSEALISNGSRISWCEW